MALRLVELFCYPVKSMGEIALQQICVPLQAFTDSLDSPVHDA